MYNIYIYIKAISITFITLAINVIPLNAQFFVPIGMPDSTITQPTDSTIAQTNDPVGQPYGGGSGYLSFITPDIVINTNDFNSLKTAVENANYGDTIYINDNLEIEIRGYSDNTGWCYIGKWTW